MTSPVIQLPPLVFPAGQRFECFVITMCGKNPPNDWPRDGFYPVRLTTIGDAVKVEIFKAIET